MPVNSSTTVFLLHPTQQRTGGEIKANDYLLLRNFIVKQLLSEQTMSLVSLIESVEKELIKISKFSGDYRWLLLAVKLDLEARGLITPIKTHPSLANSYEITSKKNLEKMPALSI